MQLSELGILRIGVVARLDALSQLNSCTRVRLTESKTLFASYVGCKILYVIHQKRVTKTYAAPFRVFIL